MEVIKKEVSIRAYQIKAFLRQFALPSNQPFHHGSDGGYIFFLLTLMPLISTFFLGAKAQKLTRLCVHQYFSVLNFLLYPFLSYILKGLSKGFRF